LKLKFEAKILIYSKLIFLNKLYGFNILWRFVIKLITVLIGYFTPCTMCYVLPLTMGQNSLLKPYRSILRQVYSTHKCLSIFLAEWIWGMEYNNCLHLSLSHNYENSILIIHFQVNNPEETMDSDIGTILTFRRLINLIDEIANVMRSAFGVNGKAVLISQKSPRTICVTKVIRGSTECTNECEL
jgi:hypothetical protein